ncbi:MAG: hypothetical protein QGH82_01635 [Candidatus Woesearchaeota archaeon]|nr:hypothetical protein [Candidatus Woesearchaeota archaeon]
MFQEDLLKDWLVRRPDSPRLVLLERSANKDYERGHEVQFTITGATSKVDVSANGSYSLVADSTKNADPVIRLMLYDTVTADTLIVGKGPIERLARGEWYNSKGKLRDHKYTLGVNFVMPGFILRMTQHLKQEHVVHQEFGKICNQSLLWYAGADPCKERESLLNYVDFLLGEHT